ncbi:unnamed protein product [Acanthosepion pharaonis]|uniref:Uncharacterized protein n=1 Tax=Acanthosepion pharaonis TaxID=158019 RepID=A0A812CP48_ACAPH|nr:unnamed protein product [Sepia pharaonis]
MVAGSRPDEGLDVTDGETGNDVAQLSKEKRLDTRSAGCLYLQSSLSLFHATTASITLSHSLSPYLSHTQAVLSPYHRLLRSLCQSLSLSISFSFSLFVPVCLSLLDCCYLSLAVCSRPSLSQSVPVRLSRSLFPSVSLTQSVPVRLSRSLFPSVSLAVCSVRFSLFPSVSLAVPVRLSVCPSVSLAVCSPVRLSLSQSVPCPSLSQSVPVRLSRSLFPSVSLAVCSRPSLSQSVPVRLSRSLFPSVSLAVCSRPSLSLSLPPSQSTILLSFISLSLSLSHSFHSLSLFFSLPLNMLFSLFFYYGFEYLLSITLPSFHICLNTITSSLSLILITSFFSLFLSPLYPFLNVFFLHFISLFQFSSFLAFMIT